MTRKLAYSLALATALAATAAAADQYVVRIDAPYAPASAGLLESLKIDEIDAFTRDGANYVVIGAPGEAHIEAYFYAIKRHPLALYKLVSDWTAAGFAGLPLEQRMPFLAPEPCGFCTS